MGGTGGMGTAAGKSVKPQGAWALRCPAAFAVVGKPIECDH